MYGDSRDKEQTVEVHGARYEVVPLISVPLLMETAW